MTKAILFDLWDTVIFVCGAHPVIQVYERIGLKEKDMYEFAQNLERSMMMREYTTMEEMFVPLLKIYNIPEDPKLLFDLTEIWKKNINSVFFPPELGETLLELRKKFKVVLVTNTDNFSLKYVKYRYNIQDYFDLIVASCEVGMAKPDQTMFNLPLRKLQIKPQEAYICGDNVKNDIVVPREMGMKTVLLDLKNTSKGAEANHIVHNVKEFIELLKKLE
ncbi:MAG TPA: HAD family hydrolase [archaeon]|nr:HAD family hydrolase [archaeon]